MEFNLFTAIGIAGAACFLTAYFANLRGWLPSSGWGFPAGNLAGALLILISLFDAWNLPSVIVESFWAILSVYGLLRNLPHGWLGRERAD